MFVPLHDNNTLRVIPFQRVTVGLLVLNVAVFAWQVLGGHGSSQEMWIRLGFVPSEFFGDAAALPAYGQVPEAVTLISYSFLHGDFLHLAGNMLFLWIFGDNVEDALGHWRFLLFYCLGAAAAALSEGLLGAAPNAPLIGASGATAACLGAYLVLHPRVRIWILLLMRIPIPLPAYGVIGLWVIMQIVFAATGLDPSTAWFAHLGGFLAGALMVVVLRRPEVPLLDGLRKANALMPTNSTQLKDQTHSPWAEVSEHSTPPPATKPRIDSTEGPP